MSASPKSRSRRVWPVLVAALALLSVPLLWFVQRAKEAPDAPADALSTSSVSDSTDAPLSAQRGAAPDGTATEANIVESPGHGLVVDEALAAPVAAWVEPDVGPAVFADADSGRFELDERHRGARVLRVRERGFEALEADAAPCFTAEGAVLRLVPLVRAGVRVVDAAGAPLADVRVVWRALAWTRAAEFSDTSRNAPAFAGEAAHETRTDSDGRAQCALGRSSCAIVHDPRGTGLEQIVALAPGEERMVVLGSLIELQFVDFDSREPCAELELAAWAPSEPESFARALRTDASGRARLAWTGSPVLVRLARGANFQAELIPLGVGAERTGYVREFRSMLRIPAPCESLPVGVRRRGARVRLVDSVTGESVDTLVRIERPRENCGGASADAPDRCTLYTPRSGFHRPDVIVRSRGGELDLPPPLAEAQPSSVQAFALVPAGFRPARFELDAAQRARDAAPHVVELERVPQRRLRVSDSLGRAYRGPVTLFAPRENVYVWSARYSVDGVHGPFDHYGGDLVLGAHRIDAATLDAQELVELVLPAPSGVLEVFGAPPNVALGALVASLPPGESECEFTPSARTPDGCRFEGLPAGSYLVGPREWVLGAQMDSIAPGAKLTDALVPLPTRVDVPEGATVRVEWNSCWSGGREIRGELRVTSPTPTTLVLAPYYACGSNEGALSGTSGPWFVYGRSSARLPLKLDGAYRIAVDDPLPWLLAVAVPNDTVWGSQQGLQFVQTLRPGESAHIDLCSLVLRWEGTTPSNMLDLEFETPPESLRYPLSTPLTKRRAAWDVAAPLRLDVIPVAVRQLSLFSRDVGSLKLALDALVPGEVRELVVRRDAFIPHSPQPKAR
jgi:hypothetical protein